MDWALAVERNRAALNGVLAMLVAMAGLAGDHLPFSPDGRRWPKPPAGGPDPHAVWNPATLPRLLHRAVLRLLRPAESAVRRLVVIAARGLAVALPLPGRARSKSAFVRDERSTGILLPHGVAVPGVPPRRVPERLALPLFDPPRQPPGGRRKSAGAVPRISVPGRTVPFPVAPRLDPLPDDRLDAGRIVLRIDALGRALDDLPGHARRFARWRARRDAAPERERRDAGRPRIMPIRMGRPPGSRRSSGHEVHAILGEVHALAREIVAAPDTS